MVTAHEAAHQWWGNILMPGKGPGGNILSEGMAHFSTILLMEQVKGLSPRIEVCRRIEEAYGDRRVVDSERPLVRIDGTRPGDRTVTYNKGGFVFWMLFNLMGRDAAIAGLQHFIDYYSNDPDHPLLQDFVDSMRPFAPDPQAFNDFVDAWFFDVVVPEYRLSDAKTMGGGDSWRVAATVENVGSGRMPVEIVAARGERFDDDGTPHPDYRESRVTITPEPGQPTELEIPCDFQPDRIVVDPDAVVLQLNRESAVLRF